MQLRSSLGVAVSLLLLLAGSSVLADAPRPWEDKSLSADQRADLVIAQLTLDEKIQLVRHRLGSFEGRISDTGHQQR